MGALDGRIAIITGAGRGIGREHALLFAAEGANVVVNDLGGAVDGSGDDRSAAQQVVDEIVGSGGRAVANVDDVCDWDGGQRLIETALESFGDLHVLVNNAGILRDRVLVNMSEADWDSVIHVHLKGHFVPTRHAAAYWREQTKEGREVKASVINTSSTSGLLGNPGQSNYGAAKAGIAAFTVIAAEELVRYGVRVNAIAPAARTRMTEQTPGLSDIVRAPADAATFDSWDPANVSPLVAYLATESCPATGRVFFVQGGQVRLFQPWTMTDVDRPRRPLDGGRAAGGDAPARRLRMSPVPAGPTAPSGSEAFQPDEVRSAETLLSGTGAGAEGGIVVPWPTLFRHRLHRRLARSDRYQWWVLWTVLAGLLSVNITFTVFVVALPQVAHQLHTTVSTLTWTSTGPLLAFGVAAPILGKLGDLRGYKRLYLWGLSGAARQRGAHRLGPDGRGPDRRPPVRRGPGGGHRGGVHGPRAPGVLPRGPGQGAWAGGRWSAPAGRCSG